MTPTLDAPSPSAMPKVGRLLARAIPGSLIAVAIVAFALSRGRARMGPIAPPRHAPRLDLIATAPAAVQIHLAAVMIALVIGIMLLVGVKGARRHRALGWTWVLAMATAAVSSLFIRVVNHGQFSLIHLVSGWVILALPVAVAAARRHKVYLHARLMTGLFVGGLILAGLMAFTPGRLMWRLVFG
jgi:uncharacterized membrane protein